MQQSTACLHLPYSRGVQLTTSLRVGVAAWLACFAAAAVDRQARSLVVSDVACELALNVFIWVTVCP